MTPPSLSNLELRVLAFLRDEGAQTAPAIQAHLRATGRRRIGGIAMGSTMNRLAIVGLVERNADTYAITSQGLDALTATRET